MKLTILNKAVVLSISALVPGYADTVTTLDHLSVNGVLTRMADGMLTLEARYASGLKTLMIPTSRVEAIEFNSTAFNPGAPPKAYGLGPGVSPGPHSAPPKQAVVTDAIELRGGNGEYQPCKVVSIDENVVHCEAPSGGKEKGRPSEYRRRLVLRVLFGGGR